MSKAWLRSGLGFAALLAVGLSLAASTALAEPRPGRKTRALNLFAGNLGRVFGNRWDCGLNAFGEVCVDPKGSTTVPGGFWPKGTPDAYIFNSGLQLAGIIDPSIPKATFSWAGDTVGAFFFDPKGTTEHGDRLSLVWSSLDAADETNWPRDAYVPADNSLFDPALQGRLAASQQDTWMQYWDGNPANNAGRLHPLGVLVTQRGLVWNFPTGNEDIIYFLYTFTNVTARNRAVYDAVGAPNADSLESLGKRFQTLNEATFGVQIPDDGYSVTQLFAAFAMDADVSDAARENYSTAFLPFSMGTAFKGNWVAPEMVFPAAIFGAPFAAAPGFVGVKYLKSPVVSGQEVGLTLFGNTINEGAFDDAQTTVQLWRYLSANLNPAAGDAACNAPNPPQVGKVCYISQATDDIRFFQSSGPLTLAPGESQTIVVAYIAAAPVDHPAIAARGVGFDLKPTWPALPEELASRADTLRSVDRVMGAVSVGPDANGNGRTDQDEVVTVPRSLLSKALVAQGVFDARFLLPSAPARVDFFLVPGNNAVTVVWKASPTEDPLTGGDPYFDVASDPTKALYDPNYREFDVEGYRIYRGRTSGDLALVIQFDYGGTELLDFTGVFNYGNCAPELGVTTDCPADLATGHAQPLVGSIIQIPAGGRFELADGSVLVVQADTGFTGQNPPLTDTGVPFAYTDRAVRNGFQYHYVVTAFDVNSVRSTGVGNAVLESPRAPTKLVTPRGPSGQETGATLLALQYIGANGDSLITTAPLPTLSPSTGIFSGPMPPTNGVTLGLTTFLPEVLGAASVEIQIDSVVPGTDAVDYPTDAPSIYHFTVLSQTPPVKVSIPIQTEVTNEDRTSLDAIFPGTSIDASKASRFGGDATYSLLGKATFSHPGAWRTNSYGRGAIFEEPPNSENNGPRWWAGAPNENTNDPNGLVCDPASGGCVQANLSRNAGSLPGVDVLFVPLGYLTVPRFPMRDLEGVTAPVTRAADFRITWGASGAITEVFDVTHQVPVSFAPKIRASWGFLNATSFAGVTAASTPDGNNSRLTWTDILCVDPVPTYVPDYCQGTAPAVLENQARVSPVAAVSYACCDDPDPPPPAPAATGNGFIFYLNGHFFMMQLTGGALPAAGTVWNARFYSGTIVGSPGSYTFTPAIRPPAVPGLRVLARFQGSTLNPDSTTAAALARIHTVPDPYYVTNAFEQSPNSKKLRFVNLPSRCIIRIYTVSGILVNVLTLDDATGGGEADWNLRNRNNQFVASGVYFYHVETPDGKSKIGRFTVVNFAQ